MWPESFSIFLNTPIVWERDRGKILLFLPPQSWFTISFWDVPKKLSTFNSFQKSNLTSPYCPLFYRTLKKLRSSRILKHISSRAKLKSEQKVALP